MTKKEISIKSFNNTAFCWEAFPNAENREIKLNIYDSLNQDQRWTIKSSKITINTKNQGAKVAECYPKSNRLETSNNHPDSIDQIFEFKNIPEEGPNVYFISCNTENKGTLFVYGNSENHKGIGLREFNPTDTELYWIIE
ncbi:hypothetical protein [Flavobacterium sp.]|uniref:hypothetical protein n=1 Tax=Flavobacterium sp. TaxID=239 RepID=UPI00404800B9